MGTTQVAEGPLIKHVRGGYAEWRAKESGLPPARLHTSGGEWWGKLVGPTDTTDPEPILGGEVVGGVDNVIGGFTDEEKQGLDDPSFETKLRDELNKELEPDPTLNVSVQPYEWKTDYTPVDWNVNYNPMPKGYGWGVSTDSPLPYSQSGIAGGAKPSSRGAVVPGGQGDWLTTRGTAEFQKPLVEFKPSPTEYVKGYDPSKRFVEKPGVVNEAIEDLKDVATKGLALGEKWVRSFAGPTAADFKPRNPKETALHNKFKKGYEIFVAAIKEGGGVFGGTLYETGGGRTTMPDTKTGEVPQAHFPNILKTLRKVFAGEKDPIVMQEYGDLHWATIIATIGMANTYGPIVWAIPGLRTMAETIGASMNGMLMDKPNLEGNPIQDTMHRLFWIAGQAGQKFYEKSVGKIIEKLRGTPKSDKTRGTLTEELNDLVNIKDAFKGHETKRIKISGDIKAAGAKHLQPDHDPLNLQITDPLSGAGIQKPDDNRGQRDQVTGQTTSPIMGQKPQGQQEQTETFGGKSPEQQRTEKIEAKTITGGPIGKPVGQIETDQLTQEELDAKPVQPITPKEIAKLADEIMGEIPKGEKFDPNRVDPDRVDPNAVRPKTERRFTPEEQQEFNRQQKQQSKQDKPDAKPAPELPKYKIQFGDGIVHEVDWETFLKETTPDENGVSNAIPYEPKDEREIIDVRDDKGIWFTDVPVDINGNPTSDPDKIHDIKALLRLELVEGQNQGEAQNYIDSITSQWNNLKEWQKGQSDIEKEFEWEQPEQRGTELRNYQGELVNQFGERINKEGKLLREEGEPKGEGSYYGGGGGYAETDYSEDELPSKFKAGGYQSTTYWHGFDTDGNEHHIQLKPEFKKVGSGKNATYYYKYEDPTINVDRSISDQMPSGWQIWNPGE